MKISDEAVGIALGSFVVFVTLAIVWFHTSVNHYKDNFDDVCRAVAHLQAIQGLQVLECPPHANFSKGD